MIFRYVYIDIFKYNIFIYSMCRYSICRCIDCIYIHIHMIFMSLIVYIYRNTEDRENG